MARRAALLLSRAVPPHACARRTECSSFGGAPRAGRCGSRRLAAVVLRASFGATGVPRSAACTQCRPARAVSRGTRAGRHTVCAASLHELRTWANGLRRSSSAALGHVRRGACLLAESSRPRVAMCSHGRDTSGAVVSRETTMARRVPATNIGAGSRRGSCLAVEKRHDRYSRSSLAAGFHVKRCARPWTAT